MQLFIDPHPVDRLTLELVELAARSILENRPLFANLLDEPVLWRKLIGAVKSGLEAKRAIDQAISVEV